MFFRFQQQPTSQPTPPSHSQYNANAMVQNQRDWAAGIPQTPEIQTQRTSYGYRHSQPIHQGASPIRSPRVSADGGWSLESLRNGSGQQGDGAVHVNPDSCQTQWYKSVLTIRDQFLISEFINCSCRKLMMCLVIFWYFLSIVQITKIKDWALQNYSYFW